MENQIKALRLIQGAGKRGLVDRACVFVSALAPSLLKAGFIRYDSAKWVGYSVTAKGARVLEGVRVDD